MFGHARLVAFTGMILTVVLVSGCTGGDVASTETGTSVPTPTEEPAEVPPVVQSTLPPEPAPPDTLPAGQVPEILVGTWTGGEGDATGESLRIGGDGSYARINRNGLTYREGVIVADDADFVTYDMDGQQETGSWTHTDAGGIEVLGVYFGPYYYSYTRS